MIEADRGSMQTKRFTLKLKAYAAYWEAKKHKEKFKIERFRVLTVTTSAARCQNLMKAAGAQDDVRKLAKMFLFTTEEQLALERPQTIFEKIWTAPASDEPCSILT